MAKDISKTNRILNKNEILDMQERVEKYLNQGGKITPDRRIYINYSTQEEYINYKTYENLINRWISNGKPENIQVYQGAIDISNDDKILPISTILDMEARVNKYLTQGGIITDNRRIYLDIDEQIEYITYSKYNEIMGRVGSFRVKNSRNPNFVYLKVETNTNLLRPNAVGDNLLPNDDGWYLSPRYTTNKSTMKQETNYWCGPNALQLVWYELTGKLVSESTIAKYAGTTTVGTGHTGLEKALKQLAKDSNIDVSIIWNYLSDLGYDGLGKLVKDKTVGIFVHSKYKNKYGHYEYVIGVNPKTRKLMINNSLSGGWIEYRSFDTMTQYINGISQKSICKVKI